VPVEALPPATLLTDQVTEVFVVPVTVAVNGWELPARTLAGFGETETWICVCGGGGVFVLELPTPAHPVCNSAKMGKSVSNGCRTDYSSK